jgi:AraC family transcriptional regulator
MSMQVAVDTLGPVREPYLEVHETYGLGLSLRPGFVDLGMRRADLRRVTFDAGDMHLCVAHSEQWLGSADLDLVIVTISEAALTGACDAASVAIDMPMERHLRDARMGALLAAVNAERVAGFPSGQLFLDAIEQALAVALVQGYAVRRPSPVMFRGGLGPARLRRVMELVDSRTDGDLTLEEMAGSVKLSVAHFSQMFHKSTGQSPHQFVLRHRVERAKEILRSAHVGILDVALSCGFKTQQHFARVFRQICGVSPTEYRREFLL